MTIPDHADYVRVSRRRDGRWMWTYHTAGNHESSGGDTTQGFEHADDAIKAAARVTGYTPTRIETKGNPNDETGEITWAVPPRW